MLVACTIDLVEEILQIDAVPDDRLAQVIGDVERTIIEL
jgi:hypothetical protein